MSAEPASFASALAAGGGVAGCGGVVHTGASKCEPEMSRSMKDLPRTSLRKVCYSSGATPSWLISRPDGVA